MITLSKINSTNLKILYFQSVAWWIKIELFQLDEASTASARAVACISVLEKKMANFEPCRWQLYNQTETKV